MATCPVCEQEILDVNLQADSYHFTGLVRCENCNKEVSPIHANRSHLDFKETMVDNQELMDGLTNWFGIPSTVRERFLLFLERDEESSNGVAGAKLRKIKLLEIGRIASKILRSFQP